MGGIRDEISKNSYLFDARSEIGTSNLTGTLNPERSLIKP